MTGQKTYKASQSEQFWRVGKLPEPLIYEEAKAEVERLVLKLKQLDDAGHTKRYSEELTKKDFITPLFRALGWDMENDRAHDEVMNEEKVSKGRVDYSFRVNGIPKFFLEAKALNKGLNETDDARQAINYSWHKGTTWAVLTDFRTIIVYNAEVKGKTAADSQFIRLTYDQFSEQFAKLWWLSKPAFKEGLLNREALSWGKKLRRTKVGNQLLFELMDYRQLLSKNIVRNNIARNLTQEDVDEAVQRIIDRLIFIRTVEDRTVEAPMLLPLAREFEEKGRGKITAAVNDVYLYFDKEYNSKLFAFNHEDVTQRHLCETLEIDNEILINVIKGLYDSRDGITHYDFSAIDADVLGNIYEQYLSHILKKTDKRAKVESKEAHRKEQGIYYTPTYIVEFIVNNTLGEALRTVKPVDADKLKVLDISCGSGSFLLKAFDTLDNYYQRNEKNYAQARLDTETDAEKVTRKTKILKNNIYGVDLDPKAVEIAQLNLLLKAAETRHRLPDLRGNIKCGNSLIDQSLDEETRPFDWKKEFPEIIKDGGFDVIIGNPPYIDSEEMSKSQPNERAYLTMTFTTAKGNWDIFCIFLERGLQLLKENGRLGLIVPNKLLSADYAKAIRTKISENYIVGIRDYAKVNVFADAAVYPIVIIIQKSPPGKKTIFEGVTGSYPDLSLEYSTSAIIGKAGTAGLPWSVYTEGGSTLLNKILKNSKAVLLEDIAKVTGAATVSEAYEIKEIITEERGDDGEIKFINSGTIDRYRSLWGSVKTTYIKGNYMRPVVLDSDLGKIAPKRLNDAKLAKIIVSGMNKRLECYLDKNQYVAGKSTTVIIPTGITPEVLLAILNSKLMTYTYRKMYQSLSLAGGYFRVGSPQLRTMPIIKPGKDSETALLALVDGIQKKTIELNGITPGTEKSSYLQNEIAAADARIDGLIYDLYGLTDEERQIVEGTVK